MCTRGVLQLLLRTSVNRRDSWIIYAARWKGTIYLIVDQSSKKAEFSDERQRRFGSWGHKFERCVLSSMTIRYKGVGVLNIKIKTTCLVAESPDKLPDTAKPVLEPEEFCCVYQRNIGSHSVIFSSIMKGLLSNEPLKEPLPFHRFKFIEVRTNRIIETAHQETNFKKFKILLWWTQCYLTNTKHVLCGFRDDVGVVHKLTIYDVKQIIELAKVQYNFACWF